MKILDLVQGTQAWLDARLQLRTASEAPAMMGESKYISRDQLLDHKKGWTSIVNEFVLKLYAEGHEAEEKARPIAERILGEELSPICGQQEDSLLMASFDGITMFGDVLFEHKLWNKTLAENVMNNVLEPNYYWQLEQQLMVSGAQKVLFMVSDGTEQNMAYMFYEPVEGRKEALLAGWKQFNEDLENHEIKAKTVPVKAEVIQDLPAVSYKMNGLAIISNLDEYKAKALELVEQSKKKLETDQDFANAESMVKIFKSAEDKLGLMSQQVLGEVESIDTFVKDLGFIGENIRQARLALDKQVKTRKEEIKTEMVVKARNELATIVNEASRQYAVNFNISADFANAIKGKRNIESMQSAINDELAKAKIALSEQKDVVQTNLNTVNENGEYRFLFNDWSQIAFKAPEDFATLVKLRISEHQAAEQKKLEAQRELIRKQEEEKAQAELARKQEEARKQQESAQPVTTQEAVVQKSPQQQSRLEQARAVLQQAETAEVMPFKPQTTVEETINIRVSEYKELIRKAEMYDALIGCGVDNWDGYSEAMEMLKAS
ncbi:TPA: YqaJ viral recombinase family protein [Vibrio cholerae]|nr:YqaJ viral recombinase family protein [Vibrio cholerae]HEQ3577799.1 YqaJ viral recombinase family protein [Vibrio cholerae]